MRTLHRLQIKGFKSIAEADITLGDLNVLIGANGAGKSNLIGVFRLLERVLSHNLQRYVASEPDRLLHHGRKVTSALGVALSNADLSYAFELVPATDSLVFGYERVAFGKLPQQYETLGEGHRESRLATEAANDRRRLPRHVSSKMRGLALTHFHDTSDAAPPKQASELRDNRLLRSDGGNLAAYLYWLQEKHPVEFRHIEEHVQLVAPVFERFVLAPLHLDSQKIKLEWRQKGSDAYFDAHSLGDGTLRFICLATLLLQPSPPSLILLDEPELGLHPYAIRILAEMLESAALRSQVLLATQSVTLLEHFAPSDVVVAENRGGATTFTRPDETKLAHWLAEFSLGELWEKNVLGGGA